MNRINYDQAFEKIRSAAKGKSLLLHVCCAPCLSGVYERLDRFDVTLFYYNPNITDEKEYLKRLSELERFALAAFKTPPKVIDGGFSKEKFLSSVRGLENEREGGARCRVCYALRLAQTAELAKKEGFDYFATTLTVSPLKNAELLNEIGFKAGKNYGVEYLPSDFKKRNGFKRSIENSKQYELYRQNYCGCEFSARDRKLDN